MRRAGLWLLALAACGAIRTAEAQVVIFGGVGFAYGPYPVAPVVLVPLVPYPWAWPYPDPLRFSDGLPSCYRFGRCSLRDIEFYRDRPHRLERLAPAAPDGTAPRFQQDGNHRASVAPTPEENIRPEYRGVSLPREEFSGSGRPLEEAPR